MTQKMRLQVTKNSFLQRMAGLATKDRVRSFIRSASEQSCCSLALERSQLRLFGHLIRMPSGYLPVEMFQTFPAGKRFLGRPCAKVDRLSFSAGGKVRVGG